MVAMGGACTALHAEGCRLMPFPEAWLAGEDGKRTPTKHAFVVLVRSDMTTRCLPEDCIKIGEPTYQWQNFDADTGPESGHIISVRL